MFYSKKELEDFGFKSLGENVFISKLVSIYNPKNIKIGNNVRIDDFVILSAGGEIVIGNYVHIACYSSLIGKGDIVLKDFVGISGRVSIYSSTDDYTGLAMTNPMVPEKFKKIKSGKVLLEKHVIIGAGSVILPDVILSEGCSVGALTLINKNCEEFTIYSGIPAMKIGKRQRKFLNYEKEFIGNN